MGSTSIQRGQLVTTNNHFGVVEYLKLLDGTILNSHENIITGYGEENTKINIFVRLLYKISDYNYWWDKHTPLEEDFIEDTVIEVDPHHVHKISNTDIDKMEREWNKKITFLRELKKHKPKIKELTI